MARGEGRNAIFEGETPAGNRVVGITRLGQRWIDFPGFDLHTTLRFRYTDTLADMGTGKSTGLPTAQAADPLRAKEDDLVEKLGSRGVFIGHQFSEGNLAIHIYSDSEDGNVTDLIRAWATSNGVDKLTQTIDPSWTQVRFLTG